MRIRIFDNPEALAVGAAAHFAAAAHAAVEARGVFNVSLSGGTTPRETYERLAAEPYRSEVDWAHMHVFWGDERTVPPEHPDSDYWMAKRALLDLIAISASNIHRMQGELNAKEAADLYEAEVKKHFNSSGVPSFDLILLGLGEDGHTASLFPRTDALRIQDQLVAANHVPELDTWRITFTYPLINAAQQVAFLVSGERKAKIVQEIIEQKNPEYPATHISPNPGELHWLLDKAAASLLKSS
jgi:6-phosphogluconolactonase